jgi:hypothetical protein
MRTKCHNPLVRYFIPTSGPEAIEEGSAFTSGATTIIGIVGGLLIAIAIAVDVTCCFANRTGKFHYYLDVSLFYW